MEVFSGQYGHAGFLFISLRFGQGSKRISCVSDNQGLYSPQPFFHLAISMNSLLGSFSLLKSPLNTTKEMDKLVGNFFWDGGDYKQRMHLVKWEWATQIICGRLDINSSKIESLLFFY